MTTVTTEIVFFFFSDYILTRLGGPVTLSLSLFSYIIRHVFFSNLLILIRLVYYSLMENPWIVLPAELLHGLTYAAMWAACVRHASEVAPPGIFLEAFF